MKLLLALFILVTSVAVYATSGGVVPYGPELDNRFDQLENQTTNNTHAKRFARATWDYSTDGGASTADIDLGVTLPANSLITRSYLYVVTPLASTNSIGTMAFFCEDANNIKTATNFVTTANAGFVEGASTGASTAMVKGIAADCSIKARVAVAPFTAGKINVFVEYVVSD